MVNLEGPDKKNQLSFQFVKMSSFDPGDDLEGQI